MNIKKTYNQIAGAIKEVISNSSPRWLVLLIDTFLVLNAFFISYLIRFNFSFSFGTHHIAWQIPMVALVALLGFLITGSYKGIVRHTGFKDAMNVTFASLIITIILAILVYISRRFNVFENLNIPISVVGMNFFVSIFFLISSRIIYKGFYYHIMHHFETLKKVMIYGAHSGASTYDVLTNDANFTYDIFGFIDDRKEFISKKVHRKNVYSSDKISKEFIDENKIEEIIISKPEASPIELMDIANRFIAMGVKVKTVPHIDKWTAGGFSSAEIKEINIEDLLNRVPININNPVLEKEIKDKTVLITGAAGSIGSEIANQVAQYKPNKFILIDQAESALYDLQQDFIRKKYGGDFCFIVGDITDIDKMSEYFRRHKPDIVYHAAAYKHVPLMEANPYEAVKINVLGSKNIMDLSKKNKVQKFVMVSTDKAVNPTNVMGATKRAAEIIATCLQQQTATTKFIITRFGNVLGSNGSVIPLFKKQIKAGGPLTVTHKDIRRFFMTIPEACQLVMEAGCMGKGGEIFVFDMGEPVKIFDLAKKMIQLSGKKYPEEIDIKITGLRPGEKLYEEILGDNESNLPTHNEKIKIANIALPDCVEVSEIISKFDNISKKSPDEIVQILKALIVEYKSNNSEFEKLDN